MSSCLRTNAVGAYLTGSYLSPLLLASLKQTEFTPRIVNITSGAGSIKNRMTPNAFGDSMSQVPYRVSKAAMNMVSAIQFREFDPLGIKVFLYGPGPTASRMNSHPGIKSTAEGVAPVIDMLLGKRDGDAGVYLEYGVEGAFPW
ncbi:hypothetical protein GGR57DRAFT_464714 [Xylariaceae sp. FL1272]|nr:hypothetical protein GGR57DRAFT_464714 [Xylariaceae sp. FL1272]